MRLATKQIKNLGEPRCNMAGPAESTVQGQERRESSNQKTKNQNNPQTEQEGLEEIRRKGKLRNVQGVGAGVTLGTL